MSGRPCPSCALFCMSITDCTVTVVRVSPSVSPPTNPLSPQAMPPPLFMSMGHGISSWAPPFPTLYFTSPWPSPPQGYSVTTYLYFLIPSPLHPSPTSPSAGNYQNMLCIHICLCSSCSLSLFFYIQLLIGMCLLPFYRS